MNIKKHNPIFSRALVTKDCDSPRGVHERATDLVRRVIELHPSLAVWGEPTPLFFTRAQEKRTRKKFFFQNSDLSIHDDSARVDGTRKTRSLIHDDIKKIKNIFSCVSKWWFHYSYTLDTMHTKCERGIFSPGLPSGLVPPTALGGSEAQPQGHHRGSRSQRPKSS